MNNRDVEESLDACAAELQSVRGIIVGLGITSNVVPYLTHYAIVRACGTIETSFKSLIADYCSFRSKKQVKRFIEKRIKEGSANPSMDNINKFLNEFDVGWKQNFKSALALHVDKSHLETSLKSLVDARNDFAHGGNPTASINDVLQYFDHSRKIIEMMDSVIV